MSLFRNQLRWTVAVAAMLATGQAASAGWMGFRNDTTNTLVIQEAITEGKAPRFGRLQKLFSFETVRDTPQAPGQRTFLIFDSNKPDKPLYTGSFPTPGKNENVLYVIKSDGKGGLVIEALKTPAGGAGLVAPPSRKEPPKGPPTNPGIPPRKKDR
ncbi:MAG TPA: hypothetical protein VM597_16995 [Gemmataceae bacterium]|jgi:hypothetical protein|nr:hypothetical protein [Gemmataceae bacterium]